MKIIAIAGVSSSIGVRLLASLEKDDRIQGIVGVDARPPEFSSRKLIFVEKALTSRYNLLFTDNKVDTAIYLGLEDSAAPDSEARNVLAFSNFIDAAGVASCQTVTLLSSTAVYGAHPDNPEVIYEGHSLRPNSAIGRAAAEMERLCYAYAQRFPTAHVQILRAAPILGHGRANFLSRALCRDVLFMPCNGELAFQFVHQDDVGRALHSLIDSGCVGIFNLAADAALTLEQLAMLTERRALSVPAPLLRFMARVAKFLGLSQAPWVELDAFEHARFPVLVANVKFRQEVYFDFLFTSPEAFLEATLDPERADDSSISSTLVQLLSENPETPTPEIDFSAYDIDARAAAHSESSLPAEGQAAALDPASEVEAAATELEDEGLDQPDDVIIAELMAVTGGGLDDESDDENEGQSESEAETPNAAEPAPATELSKPVRDDGDDSDAGDSDASDAGEKTLEGLIDASELDGAMDSTRTEASTLAADSSKVAELREN
jgi:UDP-glucose 4-epimerase